MTLRLAIAILAATVSTAIPALAQGGYGPPGGGGYGPPGGGGYGPSGGGGDEIGAQPPPSSSTSGPPDPEAHAEDLRLKGKCDQAIPIFRRLSARAGFEIAQLNLGLCLLDISKTETDPQRAAALRHDATDSILKAANSGLAKAQIKLVSLYLDGVGVVSDPVEAAKWSLIYHSNGARFAIGLPDVPADLQSRLDGTLSAANWADARSRADAWSPNTQDWDASR